MSEYIDPVPQGPFKRPVLPRPPTFRRGCHVGRCKSLASLITKFQCHIMEAGLNFKFVPAPLRLEAFVTYMQLTLHRRATRVSLGLGIRACAGMGQGHFQAIWILVCHRVVTVCLVSYMDRTSCCGCCAHASSRGGPLSTPTISSWAASAAPG